MQGTPYLNNVAAKAVFFKETLSDEYRARQFKIVGNAKTLAASLIALGHNVVTDGTDTHMILVNVTPYGKHGAAVAGGIRLGTPIVTRNGMGAEQMDIVAALVDSTLRHVRITAGGQYEIDESLRNEMGGKVRQLCCGFPPR
jgi:glycine hydroxymethyltransferase